MISMIETPVAAITPTASLECNMSAADQRPVHVPVLLDQVLEVFASVLRSRLLDLTVGAGGHSEALLEVSPALSLVGVDQDAEILALAGQRLDRFADRVHLECANFDQVSEICARLDLSDFDGALIDLGVSSLQLDDPERGFSFDQDGPLDMRMSGEVRHTAADLINTGTRDELLTAIGTLGDEPRARHVVDAILDARRQAPLLRTSELADLVRRKVRGARHHHPATRTSMGLRMWVNDELGRIERCLPQVVELLREGGRLMVISFHSGEDRIVKRLFTDLEKSGQVRVLTRKPIQPDRNETIRNPRARSARARVVERMRGTVGDAWSPTL